MTPSCPGCRTGSSSVVRDGHFFRRCDSRRVQRFRCKSCQRGFSLSTDSRRYRQKRRRVNALIQPLLCSGLSQRRMAVLLGISRTTLVRRIRLLAQEARERHWRALLKRVSTTGPFANVQFDDLHTFEHSKCKPTSVCVVVDADERLILGHSRYKSIRGCVTGQGELKKTQFDPLFCVNHTLAMLRANINRLVRRTWCTTKRNERLDDHIALYVDFHNRVLLKQTSR